MNILGRAFILVALTAVTLAVALLAVACRGAENAVTTQAATTPAQMTTTTIETTTSTSAAPAAIAALVWKLELGGSVADPVVSDGVVYAGARAIPRAEMFSDRAAEPSYFEQRAAAPTRKGALDFRASFFGLGI